MKLSPTQAVAELAKALRLHRAATARLIRALEWSTDKPQRTKAREDYDVSADAVLLAQAKLEVAVGIPEARRAG